MQKSVLFNGKNGEFTLSTADNGGIKIPSTVKQIQGINNATITITNYLYNETTGKAGLWYDESPITVDYYIRDLSLNCTSSTSGAGGFYQCINLSNCIANSISTYYNAIGFSHCDNVKNCYSDTVGSGGTTVSYTSCSNLINCSGIRNTDNVNARIYYNCSNLINCSGGILLLFHLVILFIIIVPIL